MTRLTVCVLVLASLAVLHGASARSVRLDKAAADARSALDKVAAGRAALQARRVRCGRPDSATSAIPQANGPIEQTPGGAAGCVGPQKMDHRLR